jgi:hypothetical protein
MQCVHPPTWPFLYTLVVSVFLALNPTPPRHNLSNAVYNSNIYILIGDTPETLHGTFNWAVILQYFTVLNYELFCKHNWIPLGVHFMYLNFGSFLGLKMAKKQLKHVALLTAKHCNFL